MRTMTIVGRLTEKSQTASWPNNTPYGWVHSRPPFFAEFWEFRNTLIFMNVVAEELDPPLASRSFLKLVFP